jgi:hypothetical protein
VQPLPTALELVRLIQLESMQQVQRLRFQSLPLVRKLLVLAPAKSLP